MPSGTSSDSNPAGGSSVGNPRYIDLGLDAPESWSRWSNNPSKMKLDTYFCTNDPNVPGLEEAYGLPGLMPVVVKCDDDGRGYQFLLKDNTQSFFLFDEDAGEMYRFTEEISSNKEAVYLVETDTYDVTKLKLQYALRRQN